MQVLVLTEPELQRAFDGDESLLRSNLVGQRAQQRRLAGVRRAGDHDVLARRHGRGQERGQLVGHRRVTHQIIEVDAGQPGPPHRDARTGAHPHHGREPATVRQPKVELRIGRVERPAGQAGVRAEGLDQLDQLVVAVRDRLADDLTAIRVLDEDLVAAVDVDVLDIRIVQQRLQPADAEQRGMDTGGEVLLLFGRRRSRPGRELRPRVPFQNPVDDRTRELPFVLTRHCGQTGRLILAPLSREGVGHLFAEAANE